MQPRNRVRTGWIASRVIVVPALVLLALGGLLACGGSSSPTTSVSTQAAAPAAATPSATSPTGTPTATRAAASPAGAVATPLSTSAILGTPIASPVAPGATELQVSFTSGSDTIYGSLLLPKASPGTKLPAAVIIAGSGPTDRNGNSAGLSGMDTDLHFAQALAAEGIASLRFDKVGAGQTGLASHADGSGIDFDLYVSEATDALAFLAARPEIDPHRLMFLGHSEGGLIAMVATSRLPANQQPAALVLAAPIGDRYLDLLQHQLQDQVQQAQQAGQLSADQAKSITDELQQIVNSLRTNGALPDTIQNPSLSDIFTPLNAPFLEQADQYDPAAVAAKLPPTLPVLILHGGKDQQISSASIDRLAAGFKEGGNQNVKRVELPNADHVFKDVPGTPNPSVDYTNPNLPFSPGAVAALNDFVLTTPLASR